MPAYDAILFDFDGVLIDSEPLHCACWAEVLAPLGVTLDWTTYRAHCIGVADRDMIAFLAARAGGRLSAERLWQEYPRKNRKFLERVVANPPFPPETVALIGELQPAYPLAVVSSSGRSEVEPVLAAGGLLRFLSGAVYGDEVGRHKPDPEPYILAAARLGARSPLVVEDSVPGIESARAAGFDVVRVGSADETAQVVRRRLNGQAK
ncbi:MAG: HAD family phosphatase [Bryobacteraceae bacterium]|nr:HAD family phosphatase [Bryobacteraceae bacterium]